MGEENQCNQKNGNAMSNNINCMNNGYVPSPFERTNISNRVGRDITNVLQQHHNRFSDNMQLKKAISSNQDVKQHMVNLPRTIPVIRNHARTTSSILFEHKDKNDGKNQDLLSQQPHPHQVYPFNETGNSSNMTAFSNNAKTNKNANLTSLPYHYNQNTNMQEEDISCEKENFYAPPYSHIQNNAVFNNNNSNNNSQNTYTLLGNTNNLVNNRNILPSHVIPTISAIQPEEFQEEVEEISPSISNDKICAQNTNGQTLQYTNEIISHLVATQNNFSAKGGYMEVMQSEINERMRGILLDWLVDVHFKFKLRTETLFMSINLIDRYLEKRNLGSSQLQLLGITSLFVAAKYEEVYTVPHIKDLVYVCDNAYVKEEIFQMEASILQVLDFNLLSVSSYRFLEEFVQFDELGEKNYFLARYLLEIALLEYKLLGNAPSLIAASTIYLVNKIRKRSLAWKQSMIDISGYTELEIRPCAKQICHIVQTIEQRKYLTSLRKKFYKPQFLEVAKIKIEQRRENTSNGSDSQIPSPSNSQTIPLPQQQQQQQQQNQNISQIDQSLSQVEFLDIVVPLQAARFLIEKRLTSLKESPNNVVQSILSNRLYSENTNPIELKMQTQMIVFLIEKKITNVSTKQIWQLPVTLAQFIIQSMFNLEKIEEIAQIPIEFVNFLLDTIIQEGLRNSNTTAFSRQNHFNVPNYNIHQQNFINQ